MENEQTLQTEVKESKKEILPVSHVQEEMEKLIPFAGTIDITDDQKKILFAPVQDEDVEIRPDGLIYLPWMEYVSRLRDAFGISWAIIPKDMPKFQGNHIYWPFYLMIQGKLAGFAVGEQEYQPSNARMTYGDAVEGAKSNALMRLCKGIGISLELWKPSFIRTWKGKYAESYQDDKERTKWRKKNGEQEKGGSEPDLDWAGYLKKVTQAKEFLGEDAYYQILLLFKVNHANEIKTLKGIKEVYERMVQEFHKIEKEKEQPK